MNILILLLLKSFSICTKSSMVLIYLKLNTLLLANKLKNDIDTDYLMIACHKSQRIILHLCLLEHERKIIFLTIIVFHCCKQNRINDKTVWAPINYTKLGNTQLRRMYQLLNTTIKRFLWNVMINWMRASFQRNHSCSYTKIF